MPEDPNLGSSERKFSTSLFGPSEPPIDTSARKFSSSFFGKPEPDIRENRDFIEQSKLMDALRNATPQFLKDGTGLRGPPQQRSSNDVLRTDFPLGSVVREGYQPFFPERPTEGGGDIEGTNVDLYGAYNGATALFHLRQTAPPTSPPPP